METYNTFNDAKNAIREILHECCRTGTPPMEYQILRLIPAVWNCFHLPYCIRPGAWRDDESPVRIDGRDWKVVGHVRMSNAYSELA
jgi:hypothetical protein